MHIKRFPVLPIVVRLLKTFLRLQNFYWNLLHLLVQVVRLLSNFFETVCIKPVILRRPVPSVCVRMSTCVCVCVWMSLILYCLHRAARDALKFEILLILFAVRFTTFWHRHRITTHFWPPVVVWLRRPVPSVCVRMSTCVCVCVWMSHPDSVSKWRKIRDHEIFTVASAKNFNFRIFKSFPKFEMGHPDRGLTMGEMWEKLEIFNQQVAVY